MTPGEARRINESLSRGYGGGDAKAVLAELRGELLGEWHEWRGADGVLHREWREREWPGGRPGIGALLAAIETALGLRPSLDVLLIAHVNDDRAHRVLGEFAADLAARSEGWIDLNGPLRPRSWLPGNTLLARFRLRLYSAKLALPGKVRSVEYQTRPGGRSFWSFLDAEAMRAWLRHRDFHMIK